ncbi:MAG: sensor histidine kinase [Verrucomicrobiaceae bacterium]|nr:MAG: sensor histidine kinase [Verrucomicrobiaceae bacterium]
MNAIFAGSRGLRTAFRHLAVARRHVVLMTAFALAADASRLAAGTYRADSEYLIKTWDVDDGLPGTSATAMVQTSDGYLWFGTFAGLVKFNGTDFRIINSSNTPGFPGAGVINLYLDKAGRLWVSTLEGLGVREGETWRTLGREQGWTADYVRTFAERANGDLLFTGFEGSLTEYSKGRFNSLPVPGEKGMGSFGYADPEGRWWAVQNHFIGLWNGAAWTEMVPVPPLNPSEVAAAGARDGGMWLLLGDVLLKFHSGKEVQRVKLPEASGDYWSLMEDHLGRVWITTNGAGLFRVSPGGGMRHWTMPDGLAAQSIRFAFEDRENNIWIGANGGGLQKFTEKRIRSFSLGEGAERPNFSSVCPRAAGGVWLASYGQGLFQADAQGVKSSLVPRESLPLVLQSVLEDRAGRVWVGSYGDGFHIVENGVARAVSPERTGGANGLALFEDSKGRIWMSGGQGVAVYENGQFHAVGTDAGLPPGAAFCFAEGSNGILWMVHDHGVYAGTRDHFEQTRDASGQALRGITVLSPEPGGSTMWMAARDGGLIRWRAGRLDAVRSGAGLPEGVISGLTDDATGHLWMSTSKGVARVDWQELNAVADRTLPRVRCVLLDVSDGLPGMEFSSNRQPLGARDQKGKLWFPLLRGAAVIDPARFAPDPVPPQVHMEEMSYLLPGAEDADREIKLTVLGMPGVSLPAGSRRLVLRYSGLGFAAPEKINYQVMLEGRDAGWQDMRRQNTATFYELPAGHYTFRVRAANRDGVWNETGAALPFTVRPFYWETAWFRGGGAALLMALGAGVAWRSARRRHLHMEERLEAQQQRAELEHLSRVATLSELSGSLAHELNQPLAIILSNAQAAQRMLSREPLDVPELTDILTDIVSADRRAGEVIQRLRALLKRGECLFAPESLNVLTQEVLSLTRQDLMNRGISVQCSFSPELPQVLADRVQLQQVVLNLITNACDAMTANKPEDRILHLTTAVEKGRVRLAVTDQGCGLPPGDPEHWFKAFVTTKGHGLGLGLSISRSIMQAHHGSLNAERHARQGTTFLLTLPAAATS